MPRSFSFQNIPLAPDVMLWEMAGDPSQRQWEDLMGTATSWLSQMENRGCTSRVIIDPSGLSTVTAKMRRSAGQWRVKNMALIANVVPSACYVAENAWIRGAISAVFWFAPPIVPVGVKGTREEALQWLMAGRAVVSPLA